MTRQAGAGGGDDINRTGGSSPRRPGTRPPPPAPPSPWLQAILWVALVGVVLVAFGTDFFGADLERELAYTEFLERVDAGDVERVTIDDQGRVSGTLDDGSAFVSAVPTAASDPNLVRRLERNRVVIEATRGRVGFWDVVLAFLPYVLLIALFFMIARRASGQAGALGMIGRSRAKVVEAARPTTRFDDVAGYEGVKREVIEVVDFLRQPDRYRQAGATGPRGVLLLGPPGTGKTLLGRAVAGEAEVPFLSVTGSSFVEMFVGVGAARVRDLFADARRRAPSIVFIDEIDAIGQRRSGAGAIAPHEEREQTLNQLLAEMDGFDPAEGVVVIAATNRPDILDPALLRPGRFDRQIVVPLPNQRERTAILAVHSRGKRLGADVDLTVVARGTPGFSGADLANLVNEAAIVAVRDGRVVLSASDFSEARDRILLGRREGSGVLLPDEKHAVAVFVRDLDTFVHPHSSRFVRARSSD
jgi:cell division protease FtsH